MTIFEGELYAAFADPNRRGIYRLGAAGLPIIPPVEARNEGALLPGFSNYQGTTGVNLMRAAGNTFNTLGEFMNCCR